MDLESLIDLIDETESGSPVPMVKEASQCEKPVESEDADLDSLLGLLDENDPVCDIPVSSSAGKQNRRIKLSDCIFSGVEEKLDAFSPCPSGSKAPSPRPSGSKEGYSSLLHTGDTSEEDEEEKDYLTETGQQIQQKIKPRPYYEDKTKRREIKTWKNGAKPGGASCSKEEPHSLDRLTGVRITNPLVAFDVMEKRLQGRKLIKMSFIKSYLNKSNDIEGDWVTIGVLVRKVPPKTAKTGKLFSIWKLTDLHNVEKVVSLFLFGNVHTEHWKTAVGTVVGILNPSIMEPNDKEGHMSVKVDHPGKIMLIGSSKDFGHCKSKRKDGSQCTEVVNTTLCQYCTYHVKKEYKKLNVRGDMQSSWSGSSSSFKDKLLKGQNYFYGGQSFTPLGKQPKKVNAITNKDRLTLSNLGLQRKAAAVFNEEKAKSVTKIAEVYGEAVSKTAEKNSEFINNKLLIPSVGSRNFLQHMIKNKIPTEKNISMIHPKELLRQHALQLKSQLNKKDDGTILKNLQPVLGKGLSPGQTLTFDVKPSDQGQYAKMRAIQKIRENGPIKRKNPNSVKSAPEPKKIKAALESSFEEEESVGDKSVEKKVLRSKLGCIDLNSEKIKKYLNKKSSHAYEVEMAEMEKEAAYFDRHEKKEAMEEKMSATKEMVCDVVSCRQCRYTDHKAADRCKTENHPLKCHKAIKRFFACLDCNQRTFCFSRFPKRSCRSCGGSRYERTGMIRVRSGPKLGSENLKITGDDTFFLNSL